MERIKKFMQDESGIVSTEYVVLGGIVLGALVLAATVLSGSFQTFFQNLGSWVGWGATQITYTGGS